MPTGGVRQSAMVVVGGETDGVRPVKADQSRESPGRNHDDIAQGIFGTDHAYRCCLLGRRPAASPSFQVLPLLQRTIDQTAMRGILNTMDGQRKTVLRTLALADAFGWALTGFECWRFALDETGGGSAALRLEEVQTVLDAATRDGVLDYRDGHYVLSGRQHLIPERLQATHLLYGKRRKAERWARRMIRLPYVLSVFAYGSLATGHVKEGSDLDVYVVMRTGRIFSGRVLVSLFLEVFGVRRTAHKVQDQVCLNHFAVRDAMGFQEDFRNPFSAWLWARMYPLAGHEGVVGQFYEANRWVHDFFPNLGRTNQDAAVKAPEHQGTKVGNAIEKKLGEMQLKKIERNPLTRANTGRIVANEREMIFHPGLPEEKVLSAFSARKRELGIDG